MIYTDIFDMVGHTPCVQLHDLGIHPGPIYLKLEGNNPSGSLKDRACPFLLKTALQEGSLRPGMKLLDASSGNFACALAFYGRLLGYRSAVAVSSKLTAAKRDFLTYLGVEMFTIGDFTIEGNEFCRTLATRHPGEYYFVDQLHNWGNPRAHAASTGPEILADVPDVAAIVGSLGSGGTMAGVAQFMRAHAPHVRIVVVESASGTRIPGTGTFVDGDYVTPFIRDAYDQGHFDQTIRITEADAVCAARGLIDRALFCGLQTGGVLHAAQICAASVRGPIVAVSGDTGWKNLDKLLPLAAMAPVAAVEG